MLDDLKVYAEYGPSGEGRDPKHYSELQPTLPGNFTRVIVLLRDPRDVVVSGFHQRTKRQHKVRFTGSMSEFIRDPRRGIEKVAAFNLIWAEAARQADNTRIITYELLHARTEATLQAVLHFFNAGHLAGRAGATVQGCNFDAMQARERSGAYRKQYGDKLVPANPNDPDSYKVRRGKIGSHRDEMSADDLAFCDDVLRRMNYWSRIESALRDAGLMSAELC